MTDQALYVKREKTAIPASGAAVDLEQPTFEAPFTGTITNAFYIPDATITGANTNSRTLSVYNRGANGAGVLLAAQLALVSGVNAAVDVEKALPLSGTPANLAVNQGDVIAFNSLHIGTGIADPGGLVIVEFTRS